MIELKNSAALPSKIKPIPRWYSTEFAEILCIRRGVEIIAILKLEMHVVFAHPTTVSDRFARIEYLLPKNITFPVINANFGIVKVSKNRVFTITWNKY